MAAVIAVLGALMGVLVSGASKSYLAAGVALVGAAAAVITPVAGSEGADRPSSAAYNLTAASTAIAGGSLSNVPVNLLNMALSVPAWEVQAMGRLADAMVATGSWQVWGPTNVFGFDEEDPPKLAALIDMFAPIQPFSSVLGDQLNWWARANLPMNAGCAAAQNACPDPKAMLRSMFTVPAADLFAGYRFPVVTNPFTGQPVSWSGQYVKLDRGAAFTALQGYLTAPPVGIETVSADEAATAISRLAKSITAAFDPFVQNSQWFDDKNTPFAPMFRALAPVICASCDPTNPYDNQWLKNYPVTPAASVSLPVAAASPAPAAAAVVSSLSATTPTVEDVPNETAPSAPAAVTDAVIGRHGTDHQDASPVAALRPVNEKAARDRSLGRAAQSSARGLTGRSGRVS